MSRANSIVIAMVALVAISILLWLRPRKDEQTAEGPQPERPPVESIASEPDTIPSEPTLVGREVCAECHQENFHLHQASGHASTFELTRDSEIARKFVGKSFDSGQPYGTYTYDWIDDGLAVRLPEKFGDDPFPIHYAVGSGHSAVTFLSLIPDPEGSDETVGIEHRVTWFGTIDGMGLTPGHKEKVPSQGAEFFGDPHRDHRLHRCVDCHTTSGKIVGQEVVDLIENVNCEKCHGPGSEHVRQARLSKNPPPFSVGRDDWTTESEIKLCGSCHRMPKEISVKELREYKKLLVRFQPIGLLRSACYLKSDDGDFKCTTCHNPHQSSWTVSQETHEQSCIDCHLEDSPHHVACPVSPTQDCIECHMPRVEFDDGIGFHDHWIRVHPED